MRIEGQEAIDNGADIIDSRDIIARIDYLEGLDEDDPERAETADELKLLLALREEADGCSDWRYGEALIRDSYFEDYAQQLAEDVGAISDDSKWPCTCIDWKRAARELKMDYASVEFGDVTYWIRS